MWIVENNKKVAYCKFAARDLIYSPVDEERGKYLAQRRTLTFYVSILASPYSYEVMHQTENMNIRKIMMTVQNCYVLPI